MMELIVKNWTYESGRKPTYLRSFTFDKLDFECRNDDLVKNGLPAENAVRRAADICGPRFGVRGIR